MKLMMIAALAACSLSLCACEGLNFGNAHVPGVGDVSFSREWVELDHPANDRSNPNAEEVLIARKVKDDAPAPPSQLDSSKGGLVMYADDSAFAGGGDRAPPP